MLHAQAAAPAAVEIDGPTTTSTVARTPFQLFGREVNGMQRASANGEGAAWLGGGSRSRSRSHVGSSPYSSSPPSSFPFPSSKCCSHGSGRSVARRHVSGRGSASPTRHAFSDRRLVGWSQEQMYNIVGDIDNYKLFLPWVLKSKVLTTTPDELTASAFWVLLLFWSGQRILMVWCLAVAEDASLFKELVYTWRFTPGPNRGNGPTTYVDVEVTYEFQNPIYGMLAAAAYDKVSHRMIKAFEDRATVVHGQSSLPTTPAAPTQNDQSV
eukprot:gene10971-32685_t